GSLAALLDRRPASLLWDLTGFRGVSFSPHRIAALIRCFRAPLTRRGFSTIGIITTTTRSFQWAELFTRFRIRSQSSLQKPMLRTKKITAVGLQFSIVAAPGNWRGLRGQTTLTVRGRVGN